MHKLIRTTALLLAAALAAASPRAEPYPMQPIRLIVPFAPGGAVDQVARVLSQPLSERLGQPIVIENRPGASGAVGAGELARAKPDGYTLLLALDSQAVNHHMVKNLRFDTFKSFDYLSLLVTLPQVLVVRNGVPVHTVPELIAYIKAHPGLSYGSAGTGSAGHINSASLVTAYGVEATHVPYKGAGPLLNDLLGGHIDFAFAGLSVMLPHIKAGKVRAIAISSAQHNPQLPGIPTVAESLPGFEIPTWVGLVAPVGLPPEVQERLLTAVRQSLELPDTRQRLADSGFQIQASTPAAFAQRVKKDSDAMAELVRRKIITPE
ncbi:tripartite tricarboxylate transporter substrate binding protein [Xylophilus sp. GW821-FHT01B05]